MNTIEINKTTNLRYEKDLNISMDELKLIKEFINKKIQKNINTLTRILFNHEKYLFLKIKYKKYIVIRNKAKLSKNELKNNNGRMK